MHMTSESWKLIHILDMRFWSDNYFIEHLEHTAKVYVMSHDTSDKFCIIFFFLSFLCTGACRISKAGKLYCRYVCVLRALQIDSWNAFITSIFLVPRFKVNRWVILCSESTYTWDFPSGKLNFQWISTFLLEYHQNVSRWFEPRPRNMVPIPDRYQWLTIHNNKATF